MTRYGQYCPIARVAELLGDRWTLLILREMVCGVTVSTSSCADCPVSPEESSRTDCDSWSATAWSLASKVATS